MGNYRCYNCNQEFVFLRSLKKHYDKKECPMTIEPTEEMLRPFMRVLIQVSYVEPKKLIKAEKFQYSYNIGTNRKDWKNELEDAIKNIIISIDPYSTTKVMKGEDKNE